MIVAVLISLVGLCIAAIIAIALVGLLIRALVVVLRFTAIMTAGFSLVGALGLLGWFIFGATDAGDRGLVLGGATALATLAALSGLLAYFLRNRSASQPQQVAPVPPAPDVLGEGELTLTWRQALELLPAQADLVRSAGSSCEALFRFADARPFDGELRDDAVLLRRRAPELVAHTALLWRDADATERGRLEADLIDALSELQRIADRRAGQIREETHMELAALRQRVATHAAD